MIRWEYYEMPAADMGEENPVSDINSVEYIHADFEVTDKVEPGERENLGKGMINTILPYTVLDRYNRSRKPKKFRAAVLENKHLKATFLPELGGRLWSLFDKDKGAELLYVNPVFQPANLAIRNAWFSGGVEFNVGIRGHNMLTCDNLFARIAKTADGEEVLQIYEFERVRGAVYGINAYLPEDSKILYIKDTVENLADTDNFTYWWSNIAVDETPNTRIIVPADKSFISFYNDGHYILDKTDVPFNDGKDITYPTKHNMSLDFFYKIPKEQDEKWIAAIKEDGVGLAHISTKEMIGRKLFVWGRGTGGRHWCNWLSDGSGAYIEIQAGLAYTQLEHIPIKGGTTLSWTEGYTGVKCNTEDVFSDDWERAVGAVSKEIHTKLGKGTMEESLRNIVPTEFVCYDVLMNGSGFGALEEAVTGKKISNLYEFYKNSLGIKQEPWLTLLKDGYLPEISVTAVPVSNVSGEKWRELLEKSLENKKGNHWYTYYHLGNVYYALGREEDALKAFEKSVELKSNPFGLRNVAKMYKGLGRLEEATELILKANALKPNYAPLAIDCAAILIDAEKYEKMIDFYNGLNGEMQNCGRIRLYKAIALIKLEKLDEAAEIVNKDFIMEDIREGEVSIAHIWDELYLKIVKRDFICNSEEEYAKLRKEKYPLPAEIDFRMH